MADTIPRLLSRINGKLPWDLRSQETETLMPDKMVTIMASATMTMIITSGSYNNKRQRNTKIIPFSRSKEILLPSHIWSEVDIN